MFQKRIICWKTKILNYTKNTQLSIVISIDNIGKGLINSERSFRIQKTGDCLAGLTVD